MHLGALRREQVRDRVAHRDPAATPGMERSGGVGRHELEVHERAGQRGGGPVAIAVGDDRSQHVVEPGRREIQVDEAGLRRLGAREVRHAGAVERARDALRELEGIAVHDFRQCERHGCRPVAAVALTRRFENDPARRLRELEFREHSTNGVGEIVADHGELKILVQPCKSGVEISLWARTQLLFVSGKGSKWSSGRRGRRQSCRRCCVCWQVPGRGFSAAAAWLWARIGGTLPGCVQWAAG